MKSIFGQNIWLDRRPGQKICPSNSWQEAKSAAEVTTKLVGELSVVVAPRQARCSPPSTASKSDKDSWTTPAFHCFRFFGSALASGFSRVFTKLCHLYNPCPHPVHSTLSFPFPTISSKSIYSCWDDLSMVHNTAPDCCSQAQEKIVVVCRNSLERLQNSNLEVGNCLVNLMHSYSHRFWFFITNRYHAGASLPRKDFWWGVKYAKVARPNNAMESNAESRREPGLHIVKSRYQLGNHNENTVSIHTIYGCKLYVIVSVNMSHARNAHSIQGYLSSSTKLVLVAFEQMCCWSQILADLHIRWGIWLIPASARA